MIGSWNVRALRCVTIFDRADLDRAAAMRRRTCGRALTSGASTSRDGSTTPQVSHVTRSRGLKVKLKVPMGM